METQNLDKKLKKILEDLKNKAQNKGDKGDTPIFGEDYWTPEQIQEIEDRIKQDITPIKGQDYFTENEIMEMAQAILQEASPKKGIHYRDGMNGKDGLRGPMGPVGPQGRPGDKGDKGNTPEVDYEIVKTKLKDIIAEPTFQIEKKNIKGFDMSDQRWHGAGTSGGGGTPGGSTTEVQYNNAGSFAGSPNLTYNSGELTIKSTIITTGTTSIGRIIQNSDTQVWQMGGSGSNHNNWNVSNNTFGSDVISIGDGSNDYDIAFLPIDDGITTGHVVIYDYMSANKAIFDTSLITEDRTFTFPNASGTFLLSTSFIDNEVPTGSGTAFTLANTPITGSVHLYRGGGRQEPGVGNDYTISGASITLASALSDGEKLLADYRK